MIFLLLVSTLSTSLLAYCKVADVGPRGIPPKFFKIIFWPFDHAEMDESSEEDDTSSETGELDMYEKQRLSARLITLVRCEFLPAPCETRTLKHFSLLLSSLPNFQMLAN